MRVACYDQAGFEDLPSTGGGRGRHRPGQFTIANFWTASWYGPPLCDLAHTLCTSRLVQSLTDSVFQLGGYRRPAEPPRPWPALAQRGLVPE